MAFSRRDAPMPDRGPQVEVISLIMASLSILAVSARLFRRLGMSESSFGWDDAAISLALVCIDHVINLACPSIQSKRFSLTVNTGSHNWASECRCGW